VHDQHVVGDLLDVDISVRCSSGTYIRAIARDVGAALGVGGHLTALRRTAVGPFGLDVARTLDELADDFAVLPIADAARASFPGVDLDDEQAAHVRFGRSLDLVLPAPGPHAVFAPSGEFLALYEPRGEQARPVAVFV
jgi:tRNA pseudouridine55 synthase